MPGVVEVAMEDDGLEEPEPHPASVIAPSTHRVQEARDRRTREGARIARTMFMVVCLYVLLSERRPIGTGARLSIVGT
jgi:hypothetical protein